MSETHVISALKDKRAELSGELIAAERRIIQIRADLEALDRTIRVFDPTLAPHTIRPVLKRRKPTVFQHGDFTRVLLSILRRSEAAMTVREIAAQIAADYRIDVSSLHAMNQLMVKVRSTLARQKGGLLISGKRGDAAEWRVAD
jgi:hypothetical protein